MKNVRLKTLSMHLLLVCVSFMILNSCLKKQNLDESNLGPAVNADDVQSKMSDAAGNYGWEQINKNEINTFTSSMILEDNQVTKRYKQDIIVTNRTESGDDILVDFLFNRQDFQNTVNSVSNKPYRITLQKVSSINAMKTSTLAHSSTREVQAKAESTPEPRFLNEYYEFYAISACRQEKVSCHNFSVEKGKMYLDPELASPHVCPDINNCQVDLNTVQFDLLDGNDVSTDGKPFRVHLTFNISPQLPFLSKVLQFCARGLADYNGRKILKEDCYRVNDFSYGQVP